MLAATVVFGLLPAGSALACSGLSEGPTGIVTAVADGGTLTLDSGIAVRLAGIDAPAPANARGTVPAEPLADAAAAALGALVLGKTVSLGLDDEETDRYGRMEAQVFLGEDGAADGSGWVQLQLVDTGMARAQATPGGRRCAAELMAAEASARLHGLGIWGNPYYSVRDAQNPAALEGDTGRFELIEGKVEGVGDARGTVYIDFGRTWKTDVTATIAGRARPLFAAAGIDPQALQGHRVRIRGWVENRDGPLIALTLPEQIEVLDAK